MIIYEQALKTELSNKKCVTANQNQIVENTPRY